VSRLRPIHSIRSRQLVGNARAARRIAKEADSVAADGSIRQGWNRVRMTEDPEQGELGTASSEDGIGSQRKTFITAGAIFEGTLSLKGDFHIDAEFHGELVTDGTITVGPEGSVVGDIRAREIVIRGAVVGNVSATRQLILEANAKLHGDIETACLEIQRHAFFRGTTAMIQPLAEHRASMPTTPSSSAGVTNHATP
jgi:cytoskeletal protein CcmA (bactofilin family)